MPEFPCSSPITVDLRIGGGSVELHAEPRDTAVVEVLPYDGSDGAQEAAAQTRVELSGDTLLIAAPEASGWLLRRSPRLRVTARVPAGSGGRLRVASADVSCHGEWGQVKLNSASGDVYLEHVSEDLTVNTASGDIRAMRIGGRLAVKTASGDVSVDQVGGPVDVTSASGDVHVDTAGSDVTVKTASGDTVVRAARQGTLRATTVSGDVSVGVVAGTGVWLDLTTLSGRTNTDLSMDAEGGTGTHHDLTLHVRTVSGDIEIRRVTTPTVPTPPAPPAPPAPPTPPPAPYPGVRPT
jgi:Putative adhesin